MQNFYQNTKPVPYCKTKGQNNCKRIRLEENCARVRALWEFYLLLKPSCCWCFSFLYLVCNAGQISSRILTTSHVLTINVLKLHIRYIGQCRYNGKCANVHREMCIRIRNYRWFTVKVIRSRGVCVVCCAVLCCIVSFIQFGVLFFLLLPLLLLLLNFLLHQR